MKTSGIYIHIPFCNVKCIYCDFYSIADHNHEQPRFFDALLKEMYQFDFSAFDGQFDTLFIGGGTPSLMSPKQLEMILKTLSNKIDSKDTAAIESEISTLIDKLDATEEEKRVAIINLYEKYVRAKERY